MKNITEKQIEEAYFILKRNIYYDNSIIYFKKQIADFEDDNFKQKLDILYKKIKEYQSDKNSLESYLEKIHYKKIIKKINENIDNDEITEKDIKYNYIIDCPIEIHILSIIWIKKIGKLLDKNINKYSYGYRLDLDKEKNIIKRNFFKKYFYQYQKWSNNAIKEIEHILENNEDALFIKFDLKKCYYNIFDVNLKNKLKENKIEDDLTELILKINNIYGEKLEEDSKKKYSKDNILPIGLQSSAILVNFYLAKTDEKIFEKYNPSYYGRYVDDFILVIKCSREFNKIINKKNLKNTLKKLVENGLNISDEKTIIKYFNKETGLLELEKHKSQFMKNVSTFDEVPNSEDVNKLYRKISIGEEDLKSEKFNISVYLTKLLYIYSGISLEETSCLKHTQNLKTIFSGNNIIKYYNYYMKLFTYFVLTDQKEELIKIYNKIKNKIELILENGIFKNNSLEYLKICLEFALVYNPKLTIENITEETLYKIFNSNIFNHKYINYPLINYMKIDKDEYIKHNYFSMRYYDILDLDNKEKFKLCKEKIRKSPRFIHLDELNIFYLKKYIICQTIENESGYINESKNRFLLNFGKTTNDTVFENYFKNFQSNEFNFISIKSEEEKKFDKIKIGIASLVISEKESLRGIKENNDLSLRKKEKIMNILNEALRHKVNILIFPEVTIPFQWIKLINEFSRKNNIVVVGGLEHIYCPQKKYTKDNEVYNYLFTTLPFSTKEYGTSFIKIRLKKYYAPGEILELKKYYFNIPEIKDKRFDLFSWHGFYFTNFNCFELTDIKSRAMFKNYIDLLIASVFNKDVKYFEKIIQSTCRDLHVYVAQSNTALYGDCGVVQPTKKDTMILSNIKGGINDNLLVTDLNIKSLREFQLLDIVGQDKEKTFKFLPPGIDPKLVEARINNTLYDKLKTKK